MKSLVFQSLVYHEIMRAVHPSAGHSSLEPSPLLGWLHLCDGTRQRTEKRRDSLLKCLVFFSSMLFCSTSERNNHKKLYI